MTEYEAVNLEPAIRRALVWDLVPHDFVDAFMELDEMIPGSAEGLEFEHNQSHRRSGNIKELLPWVMVASRVSADIILKAILEDTPAEEIPEDIGLIEQWYSGMFFKVTSAVIGNLVDWGMIRPGNGAPHGLLG